LQPHCMRQPIIACWGQYFLAGAVCVARLLVVLVCLMWFQSAIVKPLPSLASTASSVYPNHALPAVHTQNAAYRGLVSLGVGSVGGAPVAGCKPADASRLGVIVTGMRGGVLLTEELLANGLPIDGISGSLVGGIPSSNPLAVPADPVRSCV
jgi:hypothetical protein